MNETDQYQPKNAGRCGEPSGAPSPDGPSSPDGAPSLDGPPSPDQDCAPDGPLGRDIPNDEVLASLCKALAHPARLAILRHLAAMDSCVCGGIVDALPLAQSTVSQHLKVLKEAGLIRGEVDGPRVCYCVDKKVLARFKSLVKDL